MMFQTVESVLVDQIKDLYNAENQLMKALPKTQKAATSKSLRDAIALHLAETRTHVERLARVADLLGVKPSGKTCKAMKGLVQESDEASHATGSDEGRDAAIIAAAQRAEHYEIAAYGTARALAESMEDEEVVELLDATLEEKKLADRKLTEISVGEVLPSLRLQEIRA